MNSYLESDKMSSNANVWCSLCHIQPETQIHLFNCYVTRELLKNEIKFDEYCYADIDGELDRQEKFAKMFYKLLLKRRELLNQTSTEEDHSTIDFDSFQDLSDATVK